MRSRSTLFLTVTVVSVLHAGAGQPACAADPQGTAPSTAAAADQPAAAATAESRKLQLATFGSGCFWCTEAVYERVKGVKSAVSGYSGGTTPNPTYEEVSSGESGYAEVVQIAYDPAVISYADLLRVFWQTHDPTTLNRQGNDVGTQYRSVIFYHSPEQRKTAEQYKRQLDASGTLDGPIVTEITEYRGFVPAEKYHQDYFALNPSQRYCSIIIQPKIEKFQKEFKELLRDEASEGK